jgi:hypothetical protein
MKYLLSKNSVLIIFLIFNQLNHYCVYFVKPPIQNNSQNLFILTY